MTNGGLIAKRSGELYEQLFDIGLAQYKRDDLAVGYPTYPKIKILKGNRAIVVGQAMPDRVITLKRINGQNGQACWIEIKSFLAKNQKKFNLTYQTKNKTNTTRLNQYTKLSEQIRFGALAYYIVAFHDKQGWLEWRLFDPSNKQELPIVEWHSNNPAAIQFSREKGRLVPDTDGVPDWLSVIS